MFYGKRITDETHANALASIVKTVEPPKLPDFLTYTMEETNALIQSATFEQKLESAGITDGLIRLAVGIENVEDIIADLSNALDAE